MLWGCCFSAARADNQVPAATTATPRQTPHMHNPGKRVLTCPTRYVLPCTALLLLGACAAPGTPAPAAITTTAVPATAAVVVGDAARIDPAVADFLQLRSEAEAGDPNAQLLVAERLLAGSGTPRNLDEARAWLERAALQEHAASIDLLASLYYRGIGVPVDYARSRELMERAVAHQYLSAINNLAWLLSTCPDDSLRDGARAIALLEAHLDQSPQMLDTLAAAYAEAGNFEKAVGWQKQAVAALGGTADRRFPSFMERLARYTEGKPWRDP